MKKEEEEVGFYFITKTTFRVSDSVTCDRFVTEPHLRNAAQSTGSFVFFQ